jgi:hypothetical protein
MKMTDSLRGYGALYSLTNRRTFEKFVLPPPNEAVDTSETSVCYETTWFHISSSVSIVHFIHHVQIYCFERDPSETV